MIKVITSLLENPLTPIEECPLNMNAGNVASAYR